MRPEGKRYQQRLIKDKKPTIPSEKPSVFERRFWLLAVGVILVSVVTRVFDFSFVPPTYDGICITQPFFGLHSWAIANRAWAARSHVKYGLARIFHRGGRS
jgi:hypothetical protein